MPPLVSEFTRFAHPVAWELSPFASLVQILDPALRGYTLSHSAALLIQTKKNANTNYFTILDDDK